MIIFDDDPTTPISKSGLTPMLWHKKDD